MSRPVSTPGNSKWEPEEEDEELGEEVGDYEEKGEKPQVAKPEIESPSPAPKVEEAEVPEKELEQDNKKKSKTAKLHYLVPASKSTLQLCYNLLSSAANRYPVPTLAGWNGIDDFDAAKTHLAKLRAIKVYLHKLETADDDDLVLIVDGYDIILQLPPAIMIERYFDIRDKSDARLAERFGISVAEARARGMRNTVFLGPDKVCWPVEWKAPRCWAVPKSHLPEKAWGPKSGNGDLTYNDPRWLNSGTLIGPVGDLRRYIDATMEEIDETYDPEYQFKESDQYYMANVWGRQEYWRSKEVLDGGAVTDSPNRIIPDKRTPDQVTEFHVGIEYESALFQTKAGNDPFLGFKPFGERGMETTVDKDIFKQGENFKPYKISMPANVLAGLNRLYNSIPEVHRGVAASEWIRSVNLGVNYITKHIFPLWHCTGPKDQIGNEYRRMWFYPFAKSLLRASAKAVEAGEPLQEQTIDGRVWLQSRPFPENALQSDELGGAWSDEGDGVFVPWQELCGEHAEILFKGEEERNLIAEGKMPEKKPSNKNNKPEMKTQKEKNPGVKKADEQ